MIDLSIDLEGYGGEEPARPSRPAQPQPRPGPDGGSTIPLADLQAAGFNRTSPDDALRAMMTRYPLIGNGPAAGDPPDDVGGDVAGWSGRPPTSIRFSRDKAVEDDDA